MSAAWGVIVIASTAVRIFVALSELPWGPNGGVTATGNVNITVLSFVLLAPPLVLVTSWIAIRFWKARLNTLGGPR